jgi:hypothetical protein
LAITTASKREESVKQNEDQTIDVPQSHPPQRFAAQDDNLLAQENVFGFKSFLRLEPRVQDQQQPSQECDHCAFH